MADRFHLIYHRGYPDRLSQLFLVGQLLHVLPDCGHHRDFWYRHWQCLWRRGMLSAPCEQDSIGVMILIGLLDCGISCLRPGLDFSQCEQHGLW